MSSSISDFITFSCSGVISLFTLAGRIVDVMVVPLASGPVHRGFGPMSGQSKDYKTGICLFFAKHTALRGKCKEWLARNQDNVSEWGDKSTCGLLFQWTRTIKIQLSVLVKYKADIIISFECSRPDLAEKLLVWHLTTIADFSWKRGHPRPIDTFFRFVSPIWY